MKIVADSSTLYSPEEGKALGVTIIPSCTIINDKAYREYVDITSEECLKAIEGGAVPTTSQPAIGDVMDALESDGEEILVISIGDGLSGAYQNVMGVKNSMEKNDHIHIIDTKTLAGPERYILNKALKLREEGLNMDNIKKELQKCIESSVSVVIPVDFNFLKRSGRLTPLAAKIGGLIKIVPVMTQTEDKRRITPLAMKRSWKKAVQAVIDHFKQLGVNADYLISISHAGALESARGVMEQMKLHFSDTTMEIFQLPPTLMTHGGPGCVVVQAVKK